MGERRFEKVAIKCAICREEEEDFVNEVRYWYEMDKDNDPYRIKWCTYACTECTIKALKAHEIQRDSSNRSRKALWLGKIYRWYHDRIWNRT